MNDISKQKEFLDELAFKAAKLDIKNEYKTLIQESLRRAYGSNEDDLLNPLIRLVNVIISAEKIIGDASKDLRKLIATDKTDKPRTC